MITAQGLIVKGIGGFYYVECPQGIITCRARGHFRKSGTTPCVGDRVSVSYDDPQDGVLEQIDERKNQLVRPPVANVDKLFIVVSTKAPVPNSLIIDKIIAIAEIKDIKPHLVMTKTDLADCGELPEIYKAIGIPVFAVSSQEPNSADGLFKELSGAVSVFTGNSGVGKSTLLNSIFPSLSLQTGETSKKLGRGRHTTRHVELFPLAEKGYVADTPGFSTLDIERYEYLSKDQLQYGFREFMPYFGKCKFTSCTHTCEKGCAVLAAAQEGKIHPSRLESYRAMFEEVKDVKEWKNSKNA